MTTTILSQENSRTWESEHLSGIRHSSATVPPCSGLRSITSQADLQELKGATFTVDLTAQGAPLHADQHDVQRVFDHLRDNCSITHETLFSGDPQNLNSTEDAPRLPSTGFTAEAISYKPLTHLLNAIVLAANSHLTGPRYLQALHFDPHGLEMRDNVDSGKLSLKPDILGLLCSPTPGEPNISWKDVVVIIEVKSGLVNATKQLATYIRNHLVDRRRSFSIAVHFDHEELTLRFLCFHRSGLSTSLPLHIQREDGFRSVVEHMVGIMSIRDEAAVGLDTTRINDVYRLNGHNYEIVRTIQLRKTIRGHSTVVYTLKRAVSFSLVHT